MANLVLNGKSIDSIEDIAESFVEEDVVAAFRSGLLVAWLEEYGYEEELERVKSIKPNASSIMVLAGIIEALKLNDEVIARANAKREEQKRREELAHKAREEHETGNEKCENHIVQERGCNDDTSMNIEKPTYNECLRNIRATEDKETARDAIRILLKWYADRFLENIDDFAIRLNLRADLPIWCMLFGCNKCCSILQQRYSVWVRKSPGMEKVRLRVGRVGNKSPIYDGFVEDLKLNEQESALFWAACKESMNLGQDKYMATCVDYDVTDAIAKHFQW